MKDKTTEIFKNAPIPKAVLANAIPAIISMIMVLVYNLADTFFIGQTNNAYMVAAVSLATPAFLLFMAIGLLFGIGGTSMISRLLGEGNQEKAKHVSSFCFWTGLTIGVIGMLGIWTFSDQICRLIGASADTMEYTKKYLNILAVGVPFVIVSNLSSNILRSEGNVNKAMAGMIIGNITNIVLDPIMILLFGWGIAGAAIATVCGNILSTGFYVLHLLSKDSILSMNPKDYMIKNQIAKGVLAIGIPASLNSILMSFSNIVTNIFLKSHGDMAVAGFGVALKVNMITVMVLIGLGSGVQPLLAYCYGAGNRKRFKGVLKFSLLVGLVLSIVMSTICYCGAAGMVRSFLENEDAFTYGMQFARILILSGPIIGILFVLINTLQAMGAAIPSLILSISRQGIVYIPVLILFSKIFNSGRMLVAAQPVTDYISLCLAFVLFLYSFKKLFVSKVRDNT